MNFPAKEEFLLNLGIEPILEDPSLALCVYRIRSEISDTEVEFSFSDVLASFQVRIFCCGREISTLISEQVECVELRRDGTSWLLHAIFSIRGVSSEAVLVLSPEINCRWSLLRA